MATTYAKPTKMPTRRTIIDAASNHIYHQGYGATSYAKVAEDANLVKGNVQYHFKSKEALLKAVIDQQVQDIRRQLEEWSLDCGTAYDCIERFIAMVENNADNLSQYGCPIGTLNSELGKNNRDQQDHAKVMFDLYLRWIEARFRSFLPREQAKSKAEQLMAMAQGTSILTHAYRDAGIVHRQAEMMRHWLSEVCAQS